MSILVATLLAACGAIQVWVESPLARVFPNTVPPPTSSATATIYAAQGERESFQICVRADKKALENISVESESIGSLIPAPEIRRVGYISIPNPAPRAVDFKPMSSSGETAPRSQVQLGNEMNEGNEAAEWFPDPLLVLEPLNISPGETAAVWVTCIVPLDARAGTHEGNVFVRYGKKQKRTVKVSLQVFPFALPEVPNLRTAFTLDRQSIAIAYGLDNTSLEQWKPIYDALARERISFRLWEGDDLVSVPKNRPADAARFQEHLEYAVNAAHMNSIDIGAGSKGVAPWPPPREGTAQDPLQYYLHDMCNWLQDRGWLDNAYIEPMSLPARSEWQQARDAYFRVKRNDKRIKRMLVGVGDPYFERYTEIWAASLAQFDPYADSLLRQGLSLSLKQKYPAKLVSASSSGGLPGDPSYATQPEDAYDGCLFTYWISKDAPGKKSPQWFQVDLEQPMTTDKIKIIWKLGYESADVKVHTSLGGRISEHSGTRWEPNPPTSPYAQSWADGILASPPTFDSLYLEFGSSFHGGPVGITEVILGEPPDMQPPEHIEPIEVWLTAEEDSFPSFAIRRHPIEARLMPWVCWGHQSAGFVHHGLCQWPSGWATLARAQPLVWPVEDRRTRARGRREAEKATPPSIGAGFLFYPGKDAPIPSIRSELLRDGMEDYEYLLALDQLLSSTKVTLQALRLPDVAQVAARRLYPPYLQPQELDGLAQMITKGRIRMGWAISELAKKR
jgi:hypothetical protein